MEKIEKIMEDAKEIWDETPFYNKATNFNKWKNEIITETNHKNR